MKFTSANITSFLLLFLFSMICYGAIISTFIPVVLNMNSTPFNVFFKGVYLLIALILIATGSKKLLYGKYPWTFWFLMMFVLFYSTRMFYDIFVDGIVFKGSIINHLLFTYGGNFIPFLAIAIHADKIDYDKLLKTTYFVIFLSNLLILYLLFKEFGGLSLEMFMGRLHFSSEEGSGNNINAIVISIYGAGLSLLSIYFILFKNGGSTLIKLVSLLLGTSVLLLGASRGPQVMYFVCFFYLFWVYIIRKKKTVVKKLHFSTMFLLIFIVLAYLISLIDLESIAMYNRFAHFGEGLESDTSTREETWASALIQFARSPIIGDAYTVTIRFITYPHNVYLEILMATGLIGAFLIYPVFIKFALSRVQNVNQVGVYLLFLIPIISSVFSGSIFFNPNLFSALALMTVFKYIKGKPLRIPNQQIRLDAS